MLSSQLFNAQHGIIAWSKNADGDAARLVVRTAIRVRRSMEPTGRGAASDIGQPIPTIGAQATTTLSDWYHPTKGLCWRTRILLPSTKSSIWSARRRFACGLVS